MRLAWGRKILPWVVAVLFISGCSSSSSVSQTQDGFSKTIMQNLPQEEGIEATGLELDLPKGDFTFVDSDQRMLKVTLRASQKDAAKIEEATLAWANRQGTICPRVVNAQGEELAIPGLVVNYEFRYPADELPAEAKIMVRQGEARLSGFAGTLDLTVEEGNAELSDLKLTGESQIDVEGWVSLGLASLAPGRHQVRAGFGYLEVALPPEIPVRVVARTEMGSIHNYVDFTFLEPVVSDEIGAQLVGWTGAGGAELSLLCQNGDITINPR